MAPEVEFDSRFGVQADIYSLGVVLHVLLTGGKFPKPAALGQPAVLDPGFKEEKEEEGLRELVAGMLHGDPYQRPHSFQILAHPFLAKLRQKGDTLLGDWDDEAEKGGRVMLLSIRRPCSSTQSSSNSQSNHHNPPNYRHLLSQEERPLGLYTAYMDLAQIDDPRSTVVVCGRPTAMQHVKKGEASTLGTSVLPSFHPLHSTHHRLPILPFFPPSFHPPTHPPTHLRPLYTQAPFSFVSGRAPQRSLERSFKPPGTPPTHPPTSSKKKTNKTTTPTTMSCKVKPTPYPPPPPPPPPPSPPPPPTPNSSNSSAARANRSNTSGA